MLPTTRDGLTGAGYQYLNDSMCRGCGVPLLWFMSPNKRPIPFHIQAGSEDKEVRVLICHFSNCPNAADFRKKKANKKT